MIDYQIHTKYSDGAFSPAECVRLAKENGLVSIAITDHDTVDGVSEALTAGAEFSIEVIPGIEISAEDEHTVHILGFGINYADSSLAEKLAGMARGREERARKIVEKMQSLGFAIEYESVRRRAEGVIARPHIALEVLENPANAAKLKAEGIATIKDMFTAYLADNGRAFVSHSHISPREAIAMIRAAGGVAVWSHPTLPLADYQKIEDALIRYAGQGLEGLEVVGSAFSEDDTEFLQGLAEKYGLLKTAGSDFHDTFIREDRPKEGADKIGGYKTYGYPIEGMREALLAAIGKSREHIASPASL